MYTLDIIKYVSFRRGDMLRMFAMPLAIEEIIPLTKYKLLVSDFKHGENFLKHGCDGVHICQVYTVFEDSYPGKFWVHKETQMFGGALSDMPSTTTFFITIVADQPMRYKNDYFNSIGSDKRFREMEL